MKKESVNKFDLEAAFKALNEIETPVVRGIKPNRENLQEKFTKKLTSDILVEDYYDINDAAELEKAQEDREAEIAKAKLARIEKIVDLDAESEEDLLPSYVGKFIIQCPQCMTLFYKNEQDIEKSEENPEVVNINEICQHCGNSSGYALIGKVDTVGEEEAEEYDLDAFDENELDLDFPEGTEEVDPEGTGEADIEEESTEEANEEELELEPVEETEEETSEEEEVKESLNEDVGPDFVERIINKYDSNVSAHILELENEEAYEDAEWYENEWYSLEDVEIETNGYTLKMDRPVESWKHAEEIVEYAFGPIKDWQKIYDEGGMVQEDGENWIYVQYWVVEGFTEALTEETKEDAEIEDAEEVVEEESVEEEILLNVEGVKDIAAEAGEAVADVVKENPEVEAEEIKEITDEVVDNALEVSEEEPIEDEISEEEAVEENLTEEWVDSVKSFKNPVVICLQAEHNMVAAIIEAGTEPEAIEIDKQATAEYEEAGEEAESGWQYFEWIADDKNFKYCMIHDIYEEAFADIEYGKTISVEEAKQRLMKEDPEEAERILTEAVDKELDDKLKAHNEYIEYLNKMIEQNEEALSRTTNEFVKEAIQRIIDKYKSDLEAALPEAIKTEVAADELPTPEEAKMEDAAENKEEEPKEETKESLTEDLTAYIDLSGSQADKQKEYEKVATENGATTMITFTDSFFKPVIDGAKEDKVLLVTGDDDYKVNAPELVDNKNVKVIHVGETKESLKESRKLDLITYMREEAAKKGWFEVPVEWFENEEFNNHISSILLKAIMSDPDQNIYFFEPHWKEAVIEIAKRNKIEVKESLKEDAETEHKLDSVEAELEKTDVENIVVEEAELKENPVTDALDDLVVSLNEDNTGKKEVSDAEFRAMLKNPVFNEGFEKEELTEEIPPVPTAPFEKAIDKIEKAGEELTPEEEKMEEEETAEEEKTIELKDVEDFDEETFNEHLNKYLKEVYSNVNNFEATGCSFNANKLVVEGKINFNSGKVITTEFTFNPITLSEEVVKFNGTNITLTEEEAFVLEGKIENKTLITENFSYKYTIENTLVEGLTK